MGTYIALIIVCLLVGYIIGYHVGNKTNFNQPFE